MMKQKGKMPRKHYEILIFQTNCQIHSKNTSTHDSLWPELSRKKKKDASIAPSRLKERKDVLVRLRPVT